MNIHRLTFGIVGIGINLGCALGDINHRPDSSPPPAPTQTVEVAPDPIPQTTLDPFWEYMNTLPACLYEDGSHPDDVLPCAWDATKRGNGEGASFYITGTAEDGLQVFHYADGTTK